MAVAWRRATDGRFCAGRADRPMPRGGNCRHCWRPVRRSSNRRTKMPAWASGRTASSAIRPALDEQIAQVRARYGAVLVERFIAGREFNAAVVALPEPRLLPLAEIEFSAALLRESDWLPTRPNGTLAAPPIWPPHPAARPGSTGIWASESSKWRWPRSRRPVVATTPGLICAWRRREHLHSRDQRQSRHWPVGRFRPSI